MGRRNYSDKTPALQNNKIITNQLVVPDGMELEVVFFEFFFLQQKT